MRIWNLSATLICALSGFAAYLPMLATAQGAYPSKPIKLVVPFAPGGTTDIVARVVADKLGPLLGQPVVVDNRPGAGGSLGTDAIAKSAPDGYTLGVGTVSTLGINPAVFPKLPFDVERDLQPISNLASVPNVMSANPSTKAKTIQEFIALAKSQPGKLSYGTPGNGSLGHLMGEAFGHASQTQLLHVPYKGAGPALNDALAGQIDVLFDNLPSSLQYIQAGKLRALAVAAPKRLENFPDVPTFAEVGLHDVNGMAWFGVIAPAKTPEAIVTRLHGAIVKVLAMPEVAEKLKSLGAIPVGNSPAQFGQQIKTELEKSRRIVKSANIQAN